MNARKKGQGGGINSPKIDLSYNLCQQKCISQQKKLIEPQHPLETQSF